MASSGRSVRGLLYLFAAVALLAIVVALYEAGLSQAYFLIAASLAVVGILGLLGIGLGLVSDTPQPVAVQPDVQEDAAPAPKPQPKAAKPAKRQPAPAAGGLNFEYDAEESPALQPKAAPELETIAANVDEVRFEPSSKPALGYNANKGEWPVRAKRNAAGEIIGTVGPKPERIQDKQKFTSNAPTVRQITAEKSPEPDAPEFYAKIVGSGPAPQRATRGKCGGCGVAIWAPTARPIRLRCPRCMRSSYLD